MRTLPAYQRGVLPQALPGYPVRDLILEQASRLDAFSGYPFRRSLTSHAPGGTTGTRELRPSRSSRTRDSLPQVSYVCRGYIPNCLTTF